MVLRLRSRAIFLGYATPTLGYATPVLLAAADRMLMEVNGGSAFGRLGTSIQNSIVPLLFRQINASFLSLLCVYIYIYRFSLFLSLSISLCKN